MNYTEQQEKIYLAHVKLLENNHTYSQYALRELYNSYALYQEIKQQPILPFIIKEKEVWLALASLPINDITINAIERLEKQIRITSLGNKNWDNIMKSIIRLQIAMDIPIAVEHYAVFLKWFDQLYIEVISKRYRDAYQTNTEKVKKW